ncbi:hypothetical protein [Jeotgalibacillus marinus]|uniref:Lipoprotein n=1 Tax=Jeotgalibacillus marinus TaxID=86667 RepID=A0ABV3Q7N5_9BACL
MKKLTKIFYCNVALLLFVLLLVGCTSGKNEEAKTDPSENDSAFQSEEEINDTEESNLIDKEGDESESATDDSNETSSQETRNAESNNTSKSEEDNALSEYSSEEIEYARVWLQLGPNQELDELNVRHIPAGEPINPTDDTSASYPEDVIQLAGSRLVDGSVTYSGNGDGTINIYIVPLRWEIPPADVDENFMQEYTEDIIENTELVYIDTGDDEKIIEHTDIMNIH